MSATARKFACPGKPLTWVASIVLCYQQDFYVQSLGHIADAMNAHAEKEPALKSTCTQLVISLC